MLAILGEIEVQLQTGFTALEATLGGEFAEQARIGRKPGLQWVGDKGDEYRLSVRFHQQYCQPTAQWQRLQAACRAHQALAFVLGNGEYLGHFVITTLTGRTLLAHADGIAQCLEVDISLREFTGDLRQPLKPPAMATTLNRKAAGLTPAIGSGTPLSRAMGLARQAQSALATASQAIRVARQMKTDPVAALTRVPGVINSLGEVATPLIQAQPLLAGLEAHFPAASSLTRAAGKVATTASQAKNTLGSLTPGTSQALPGVLDTVAGQVGGAVSTWNDVAPLLSRLTGHLVTRR
ncbi:phage tail protein [Symbiopectobacterium sp. Eva_TO]